MNNPSAITTGDKALASLPAKASITLKINGANYAVSTRNLNRRVAIAMRIEARMTSR
jgi:hypothetical protein